MRCICADVGGTKTILALYQQEGEKVVLERQEKYVNSDFSGIIEMCHLFLGEEKVDVASLALAAPILGRKIKLTNLPWVVDADLFARQFNLRDVFLVNDLKASAYTLSTIPKESCYSLQAGEELPHENKVLISPGTGLGEAILFFDGKGYIASATEGGHTDFAPRNEREMALFRFLHPTFSHISVERIVSGKGLIHLYRFLVEEEGRKEDAEVKEALAKVDPGKVITQFGLQGEAVCREVLVWFCSLLGAEAGNLALKTMALGGVFVGGGIPYKILEILKEGIFLESFLDKGRFSALLKKIPLSVVLEENSTVMGAFLHAQKMVAHKI